MITYFNAGSTITFPLFIWGAARVAIPPQIYVIATMIFLFTVAMMLLTVWQQRRAERMAAVRPETRGGLRWRLSGARGRTQRARASRRTRSGSSTA